jgi:hypothetical protein
VMMSFVRLCVCAHTVQQLKNSIVRRLRRLEGRRNGTRDRRYGLPLCRCVYVGWWLGWMWNFLRLKLVGCVRKLSVVAFSNDSN